MSFRMFSIIFSSWVPDGRKRERHQGVRSSGPHVDGLRGRESGSGCGIQQCAPGWCWPAPTLQGGPLA